MTSTLIPEPLVAADVSRRIPRANPQPAPTDVSGYNKMNSLKDKVTIITGAVGNLGTATARLFQQAGAKTVLVDRSQDRVREAFKDIADSDNHLLAGGIDLSDAASLGKLIE